MGPREQEAIREIAGKAGPRIGVWVDRERIAGMDFDQAVFDRRGKPLVQQ
jgi:hypothetical protein